MTHIINPRENTQKTYKLIVVSEKLARWAATIFTSVGFFVWARDLTEKYLPEDFAYSHYVGIAAGLIAAIGAAILTDMMFGDLLQKVTFDLLAKNHPNVVKWSGAPYFGKLIAAERIGFIVLLLSLLSFDLYTSLVIRDPIADSARSESLTDPDKLRAEITAQVNAEIGVLTQSVSEKQKEIKQKKQAVLNSNKALAGLAQKGNGWAEKELSKSQKKATSADEKALQTIDETRAAKIAASSVYIEQRLAQVMSENEEKRSKNERNRTIMAGMYSLFTVVPKLLAILLRCLMVVSFLAYSQNYNPDLTGDGIISYDDVNAYTGAQATPANYNPNPPAGTTAGAPGAAFP